MQRPVAQQSPNKGRQMLRMKRVHSETLRDEVYALRYRAYRREEAIDACPTERFTDTYDAQPNHIIWALTEHERVIGSIRTTWYDPAHSWSIPEMEGYGEDVARIVPQNMRILSGNRFVTEPDQSSRSSLFAMLLLRYYMIVAHQRAEYALAAVRINHLPFYRRVLQLERASEGRTYPGLNSTMCPSWSMVMMASSVASTMARCNASLRSNFRSQRCRCRAISMVVSSSFSTKGFSR